MIDTDKIVEQLRKEYFAHTSPTIFPQDNSCGVYRNHTTLDISKSDWQLLETQTTGIFHALTQKQSKD
jgi:hypothetical protein